MGGPGGMPMNFNNFNGFNNMGNMRPFMHNNFGGPPNMGMRGGRGGRRGGPRASPVPREAFRGPVPSAETPTFSEKSQTNPVSSETKVEVNRDAIPPVENEPEYDDSLCILDWYNSDLNLNIQTEDFCSAEAVSKKGFGYMWAGARATYGATRGRVCFEVRVDGNMPTDHLEGEETPNVLRVGWSTPGGNLQLGEVKNSFGFGGTAKAAESCKFKNYGCKFGVGDVVGAYLDMSGDSCTITFAVNGKDQGVAFRFQKKDLKGKALFPHVLTKNQNFTVNFGQLPAPLFPLMPGFTPIGQLDESDGLQRGPKPPSTKADCEVLMMIGLPGAGKTYWAEKYASENEEKNYNILGTNNLIEKMKVNGLSRKRNYHGRWEVLIKKCTECFNEILLLAAKRRRNYILDQTNVYPTARGKKLKDFNGFDCKAVTVVPSDDEFRRRVSEREAIEGKEIPDSAVLNMKANFVLPEVEEVFKEVIYTELPPLEALHVVTGYNEEGRVNGMKVMPGVRSFKFRNEAKRREQGLAIPGKHISAKASVPTEKGKGVDEKIQASTSSLQTKSKDQIKTEIANRVGELKRESRESSKPRQGRSKSRERAGSSKDRRRSRSRDRRGSRSRDRSKIDRSRRSRSSERKPSSRDRGKKRSRSRSRDRANQKVKKEVDPWEHDASGSARGPRETFRESATNPRNTGSHRHDSWSNDKGRGGSSQSSDYRRDHFKSEKDEFYESSFHGGRGRGRGRGSFDSRGRGRGYNRGGFGPHSNNDSWENNSHPRGAYGDHGRREYPHADDRCQSNSDQRDDGKWSGRNIRGAHTSNSREREPPLASSRSSQLVSPNLNRDTLFNPPPQRPVIKQEDDVHFKQHARSTIDASRDKFNQSANDSSYPRRDGPYSTSGRLHEQRDCYDEQGVKNEFFNNKRSFDHRRSYGDNSSHQYENHSASQSDNIGQSIDTSNNNPSNSWFNEGRQWEGDGQYSGSDSFYPDGSVTYDKQDGANVVSSNVDIPNIDDQFASRMERTMEDDYGSEEYDHGSGYASRDNFNPSFGGSNGQNNSIRGSGGSYGESFANNHMDVNRQRGRDVRMSAADGQMGDGLQAEDRRGPHPPNNRMDAYRNENRQWINSEPISERSEMGMTSRRPHPATQIPAEQSRGFAAQQLPMSNIDQRLAHSRDIPGSVASIRPSNEVPRYSEELLDRGRPRVVLEEKQQPPAPIIPNWNSQPEPRKSGIDGAGGRFPISSDGKDVGMGYSVQFHSQDLARLPDIGMIKKSAPDQQYPAPRTTDRPNEIRGPRTHDQFTREQHQGNRLNLEPNPAAGMNPPAPDAGPSSGVGPGQGEPNSGPDYAALLQYLQYYQKQMGNQEANK